MGDDYALFAAIVRTGSLTAAGREARLSPAAVSKRLTRLEARLGVRLLHRTTRKVTPTETGRAFYEDVVGVLAAANAAEARAIEQGDTPSGRLRVVAPSAFARLHIAPHVGPFLEAYPRVHLEMILDEAFTDLVSTQTDLAIRISPPPASAADATLLAPNRRILCAAPAYLKQFGAPTDLRDLAQHRLLASTLKSEWRLHGPSGARSVDVHTRVTTNSSELIRDLTLAGLGIALRSTWDVSDDLKSGKLVRVLPQWRGAEDVGIYAVRPRAPISAPSVTAFTAHLKALYGPTPYWDAPEPRKEKRLRVRR